MRTFIIGFVSKIYGFVLAHGLAACLLPDQVSPFIKVNLNGHAPPSRVGRPTGMRHCLPVIFTRRVAPFKIACTMIRLPQKLFTWIGITSLILFVAIYGVELVAHSGPPVTIKWIQANLGKGGLIALNILIVIAFLALLPYRRSTISTWKSKGMFIAFVIALMTEMFGWPLLIFLVSPLVEVPSVRGWVRQTFGHAGPVLGTWVSMAGLLLIALGWRQIHKATGLITTGIYRFVRHPQYTGIFLFTLGWILHWPSVITLIFWPILVAAYVWLARREEAFVIEEFGDAYRQYAQRTPRFFPRILPAKSRG